MLISRGSAYRISGGHDCENEGVNILKIDSKTLNILDLLEATPAFSSDDLAAKAIRYYCENPNRLHDICSCSGQDKDCPIKGVCSVKKRTVLLNSAA